MSTEKRLGYLAAKDLLGDDDFKLCFRIYGQRHGKHPTPWTSSTPLMMSQKKPELVLEQLVL
jgi:hypothetical protein